MCAQYVTVNQFLGSSQKSQDCGEGDKMKDKQQSVGGAVCLMLVTNIIWKTCFSRFLPTLLALDQFLKLFFPCPLPPTTAISFSLNFQFPTSGTDLGCTMQFFWSVLSGCLLHVQYLEQCVCNVYSTLTVLAALHVDCTSNKYVMHVGCKHIFSPLSVLLSVYLFIPLFC